MCIIKYTVIGAVVLGRGNSSDWGIAHGASAHVGYVSLLKRCLLGFCLAS